MTASPAAPRPAPHSARCNHGVAATRWLASGSLLALIALCLAWELVLAPLRPGGSWLALQGLAPWPPPGRPAEEPHVHLPLGQPGGLALLHRRRGARLGGQAPVAMAGLGRGGAVPGAVCRLRSACAIAPAQS